MKLICWREVPELIFFFLVSIPFCILVGVLGLVVLAFWALLAWIQEQLAPRAQQE